MADVSTERRLYGRRMLCCCVFRSRFSCPGEVRVVHIQCPQPEAAACDRGDRPTIDISGYPTSFPCLADSVHPADSFGIVSSIRFLLSSTKSPRHGSSIITQPVAVVAVHHVSTVEKVEMDAKERYGRTPASAGFLQLERCMSIGEGIKHLPTPLESQNRVLDGSTLLPHCPILRD